MKGLARQSSAHGPWADRAASGHDLGHAVDDVLGRDRTDRPLVLGLPRGGVVVAAAVAAIVDGELDVLVVRKVGVPWHRELALGAVTASGLRVLNSDVIRRARLDAGDVERAFSTVEREARERERMFRADRPAVEPGGRIVVLVDDGLATGATALAATQLVRNATPPPRRVVLAAPVAPPDTVRRLAAHVDDVVVLAQPADFLAVGEWFADFTQVDDTTVQRIMARSGR
ncbi:phosphoribosyltransferase [Phytoactinopolyspora limicola]|uniref:phosphoribosyltransferase n=1 Tax=Phytoactinopolyspora limicola TaxID=2715536 RepID=UPI00140C581D|nr:phosphoribosyltransferase family protein [Phytoactinopolyspora limicola]